MCNAMLIFLLWIAISVTSCDSRLASLGGSAGLFHERYDQVIAAGKKKVPSPQGTRRQNVYNQNYTPGERQYENRGAVKSDLSRLNAVLPLLKQVGAQSITVVFGIMLWRLISIYDLIVNDQRSALTKLAKGVTIILFVTNLVALGAQLIKPLVFKNFLKIVLALDIFREFAAIVFNLVAAFITRPNFREVYIGRIIGNFFWASICYGFSRSRWVFQPQAIQRDLEEYSKR